MLLYVKVSDNLLRIFEKLKHSFTVKICVTVGPCLEFPQKISMLILYYQVDIVNMWLGRLLIVCGEVSSTSLLSKPFKNSINLYFQKQNIESIKN